MHTAISSRPMPTPRRSSRGTLITLATALVALGALAGFGHGPAATAVASTPTVAGAAVPSAVKAMPFAVSDRDPSLPSAIEVLRGAPDDSAEPASTF